MLENGAYGKRMGKACECMGVDCRVESFPEDNFVDIDRVKSILKGDNSYTMVAIVHCETSSGVFNPVEEVGKIVKEHCPGMVLQHNYVEFTSVMGQHRK